MKDTKLSYLHLRNTIGIIGVFLPLLLIVGSGLFTCGKQWLQLSISHYYYSVMHILFMWALIILGITLIIYKGDKEQEIISTIAGFASFGVATFPTIVEGFIPYKDASYICLAPSVSKLWNYVHFSFATILFSCFAVFCCRLFQKPDKTPITQNDKTKKIRRNCVYHVCGAVIIACIICIAIFSFILKKFANKYFSYYVIVFEIPALMSFGISWLIKGSTNWHKYSIIKNIIKPFR